MKLSLVFELLLIFILLAFAASKSVKKERNNIKKQIQNRNDAASTEADKIEDNSINKYCKCVETYCNCCRDFRLPVVELNGPGCASLMYLNDDKMSVSLSFGKKVIANRTLSSRKPSPVCMPLPGGISKFCGRVYNIARAGEEFRACLGLELQSKRSVEAAVRVSCFKFGPRGVTSEPADPLPLVPQDEKNDDDDDDDDYEDDDEDDFGLGGADEDDDDDDDDDDDGTIDAVNDVDSADYTGFSILGEDILGDLFGSTGTKKPKKSNKKQAPAPTTTTTTTRRPRPTRRPSRKPSTRTTTPRPTRTTTVRSRPATSRRPTRKPARRPTRKPTTESTSTSISTTTFKPSSVSAEVETTVPLHIMNTIPEQSFAPVSAYADSPTMSVLPATTPKSVTDFEDPGLEMSLAHITGQLSEMQVTPMISNEGKDSAFVDKEEEQPNYEKIQTITPKAPSTVAVAPTSLEVINDDMVQIVHNLDSHETIPEGEPIHGDESRGHEYNAEFADASHYYEGQTLPKKHKNKQFNLDDLDILDLGKIGESVGDELGLFGKNRRHRDNKNTKVHGQKQHNDDYDDLVDAIGHTLMMRRSDKDNKNKKDRRRQNKMMRGEWSSQPMSS